MELAQKPGTKTTENCKLMAVVAPGVATLHGGDPAAQGSGVLPQPSPQAGQLPSRAHRQLPLEKGTAAGRGPRPSRSPCQPRHTQRRALATPGGNNRPVHQCQGEAVSPVGTGAQAPGSQSWGAEQQQNCTPSKEQLSPAGRARHCRPVPRILFALPSPGTGSLGQAASCPTASVSPAGRDGRAWAGGGLPRGDPSLL